MANFQIGLEGKLLVKETKENIGENIQKVSSDINKDTKLQLIAKLHTDNTVKIIQKQLDQISPKLKLNIGLENTAQLKKEIENLKKIIGTTQNNLSPKSGGTQQNSINWEAENNKLNTFIANVKRSGVEFSDMSKDISKLKPALDEAFETNDITKYNELLTTAQTRFKLLKTESATAFDNTRIQQQTSTLISQINTYKQNNTKALDQFGGRIDSVLARLKQCNNGAQLTTLRREWRQVQAEIDEAGLAGKTFFQTVKEKASKFAGWFSISQMIMKGIQYSEQMVQNVIQIDTAMTNLKKVTNETNETYNRFLNDAGDNAQKLHSKMSDLIEQTSQWSKLGYDLAQSQKLSNASMIYSNVGEVDNEQAVTNIVTSMKAFNIAADDVMKIPDVYNKLGNEFAVSSKNLGSGMAQAATTLAMAGNSFEQSAALLTGAGEVLGDNKLEEIGNGIKTVTLRIQNQSGALQELGEEYDDLVSVSKTQQQVYELTKGQVNIMSDTDPTKFKDTYTVLEQVANVVDDLTETDRAELIQLLFGKHRANIGTAVLNAFQSGQIQKAFKAAQNSAGSAEKEFSKYSESAQAHINDLMATLEDLSVNFLESDTLKFFIDGGNDLLGIINAITDNLGGIPTLISAITAAMSLGNKGGDKMTSLFIICPSSTIISELCA